MRILHTSDWHLGKTLEGYSRLEEQQNFIEDLIKIADESKVDMIIIAGDIYDNGNPSANAEKLFYEATKRLSLEGKRPILIIAGNHDNPERLTAINSWAYENGIIILGTPKSVAQVGDYKGYKILNAESGYIEIEVNNEKAIIITLPYPSEKRLNELISDNLKSEKELQATYSDKIGQMFSELNLKYRSDTINIAVAHIFMIGGEESDSERPIQLGGSLAVSPSELPKAAQYIALGHLHRAQKVRGTSKAYYSGSPLQYSKSEINYTKKVYIVDLEPNKEANVENIILKNYKPIEIWECSNIEEALWKCEQNKDKEVWVYLDIYTDRIILPSEIKAMKSLKKDIVEIHTALKETEIQEVQAYVEDKSISELFKDFYFSKKQTLPSQEILDLFIDIKLGGDENET